MDFITDLYQRLFGKNHIQDGNVIDMAEHGRVGGISSGEGYKKVGIWDVPPTDQSKSNPSLVLSNTDPTVASTKTITKTIGATQYLKTLSLNAGGDVVQVSAWSEL